MIITVDEFNDQKDAELCGHCGTLLQRIYPGYVWGVRRLAKSMVGITLAELMQYGDMHVMVINPKDYTCMDEFDKIAKRLGGELLERARLCRTKSYGNQVTQRPDGFNSRFDKTIRETKIRLRNS